MRNEKILQLIAYYLSIDGNINDLYDELVRKNSIIDELFTNCVLNNIYLILYDKNLTPIQMINKFTSMNYEENSVKNKIQDKEDEILNLKDYIQKLNKRKEEIHNEFIDFCKDKHEIKNKYFLINSTDKNNIYNDINMNVIDNKYNYGNIMHMYTEDNKNNNDKKVNGNAMFEEGKRKDMNKKDEVEVDNIINRIINKNNSNSSGNNNGMKTRKKDKIVYFEDKYYKKGKKFKKLFRKSKSIFLGKASKYYLDDNK
jgi:hypothetical protein